MPALILSIMLAQKRTLASEDWARGVGNGLEHESALRRVKSCCMASSPTPVPVKMNGNKERTPKQELGDLNKVGNNV